MVGSSSFEVVFGAGEDNQYVITSHRAVAHPDWDQFTFANDIAILELDSTIEFGGKTKCTVLVCIETLLLSELAQPICLPSSNDYEDQTALLIGNLRKYSRMSFVNENDCEAYWGPSENIICTEANCDCDIATGILVIPGPNYQQIGIAGMGSTMGCIPGLPKTYTEVYPYLDWISSVTGV